MNTSATKGMAEAFRRRLAVGVLMLAGSAVFLTLAYFATVDDTPSFPAALNLLLWGICVASGILLLIGGCVAIVKAARAFSFAPPASPEDAMKTFLRELMGGVLLPGNAGTAFLCLSPDCQERWRDWLALKHAVRLFSQSLKQEYKNNSIYFEVKEVSLLGQPTEIRASGIAKVEAVLTTSAGEEDIRAPHDVEFSLIQSDGSWYVDDFNGGASAFQGKGTVGDLDSPEVKSELRSANTMIRTGWIMLVLTYLSIVCGLILKGNVGAMLVIVVPFFSGFAAIGFLGNGFAKRGRYK